MRPDLAGISGRSVRGFRKVDAETEQQSRGHGHHLLTHPCQRQEGNEFVSGALGVVLAEIVGHGQQVGVRQHGELGTARGAGSGRDQRGAVRVQFPRPRCILFYRLGLVLASQTADGLKIDKALDLGFVSHQPLGFVIDDICKMREVVPDGEHLVHLLLIFGNDQLQSVNAKCIQSLRRGILIQPQSHAAKRLNGEFRPDPLGPVVSDENDDVAGAEAKSLQSAGEFRSNLEVLPPCDGLPHPHSFSRSAVFSGRSSACLRSSRGSVVSYGLGMYFSSFFVIVSSLAGTGRHLSAQKGSDARRE